jgi:predicted MarR family transcription regulator
MDKWTEKQDDREMDINNAVARNRLVVVCYTEATEINLVKQWHPHLARAVMRPPPSEVSFALQSSSHAVHSK